MDHFCEVWSKSNERFQRRCCLKKLLTDARIFILIFILCRSNFPGPDHFDITVFGYSKGANLCRFFKEIFSKVIFNTETNKSERRYSKVVSQYEGYDVVVRGKQLQCAVRQLAGSVLLGDLNPRQLL